VTLLKPLAARVGNSRVYILQAGIAGFHIAHQGTLPRPGSKFHLEFEWEARRLGFELEVVHNDLQKLAKSASEKSLYHAGTHIVSAVGDAAVILRKLVIEHVERALDEQRANARGIPAKKAHAFQTGGKNPEYVRCQFVKGEWRRSTTTRHEQPADGFAVSAEEDPVQIDMLCQSYESGDESMRNMIRMMAEASINADSIPTRKYNP
jgi:hypothetical protein